MKEIWEDIPNYEGLYQISNLGVVKSLGRIITRKDNKIQTFKERFISIWVADMGYYRCSLTKDGKSKIKSIHRILAEIFIPNPLNKCCVNHKDGNKLNNELSNLEWVTQNENIQHALKTGLTNNYGENSYRTNLTNKDIVKIKKMSNVKKYTYEQIAKKFNTTKNAVGRIVREERWNGNPYKKSKIDKLKGVK